MEGSQYLLPHLEHNLCYVLRYMHSVGSLGQTADQQRSGLLVEGKSGKVRGNKDGIGKEQNTTSSWKASYGTTCRSVIQTLGFGNGFTHFRKYKVVATSVVIHEVFRRNPSVGVENHKTEYHGHEEPVLGTVSDVPGLE